MVDPEELASFLYYGFVPRRSRDPKSQAWVRPAGERLPADTDLEAFLSQGVEVFRAACADPGPGLHVLPLSGGGDSRLILAMLLEAGLGERLVTVTFGTPGTMDFEFGRQVARHAGVRHEVIDLTQVETPRPALEACLAARLPWTLVWDAFFNDQIPLRFGPEATYWSGYMSNTLAGGRYAPEEGRTWDEACALFAARVRIVGTFDLSRPGFRPRSVLPAEPFVRDERLTFYEQLYLGLMNPQRFEPALFLPGYKYRSPFTHPQWVDFGLRVPASWRRDQRFLRQLMLRAAPELFRLPTKIHLGPPLGAPHWRVVAARARSRASRLLRARFPRLARSPAAKTNFVDFDVELRRPSQLCSLVRSNLNDLRLRGAVDWIDIEQLWREHTSWRCNRGRALAHLAALELCLKSIERTGAAC